MKRENAFDTFAVGNTPHGDCFVKPAPFAANHDAGENLNPLLVALHHSRVHADAIAHGKLRSIALLLPFFDGVNNAVHNYPLRLPCRSLGEGGPGYRANIQANVLKMQTETSSQAPVARRAAEMFKSVGP